MSDDRVIQIYNSDTGKFIRHILESETILEIERLKTIFKSVHVDFDGDIGVSYFSDEIRAEFK
jgi:hypothetical protein